MIDSAIKNLSETQLEAFYAIAQAGSFSKGAVKLHLSQPALTRRLQALEQTLGLTLFTRTPQGVELQESGRKLLHYLNAKRSLESELIEDLLGVASSKLSGLIRIASQSSLMQPIIIPSLAKIFLANPEAQIEVSIRSGMDQDKMLNYSKTDIIFSNEYRPRKDVVQYYLGEEEYVCIESKKIKSRNNVYLDGRPEDTVTFQFLDHQVSQPKNIVRSFMHDENGILSGVKLGLGRAIKPKHTIKNEPDIRIVPGLKSFPKPVFMRVPKKQFFTPLERQVIDHLIVEIPKYLRFGGGVSLTLGNDKK